MQDIKPITQLIQKCRATIGNGTMETCFDLLEAELVNRLRLDELLILKGNLNRAKHSQSLGLSDTADRVSATTTAAILEMLNKLTEVDISPINPINGRILILSPESKVAEWRAMFSPQNFSHAYVIHYGQDIPLNYRSPDVVIFDDTGPNARPHIVRLADEMPQAHFLYFGDLNPFTETRKRNSGDASIFDRCANANSKFTVHARLRELLEFRKIYGVPSSTNS
jgi:hypothetical protein